MPKNIKDIKGIKGTKRFPAKVAYTTYPEVFPIWGYIVNVHDSVNFDIDLKLTPELHSRYSNVITNNYTYTDLVNGVNSTKASVGIAYRCRLKHVGLSSRNKYFRAAHIEMIRHFDRQNGWVLCRISDVDIYRRLLVSVYDPITQEDLSQVLLKGRYAETFHPYQTKKMEDFYDDYSLGSSDIDLYNG